MASGSPSAGPSGHSQSPPHAPLAVCTSHMTHVNNSTVAMEANKHERIFRLFYDKFSYFGV